MTRLGVFLTLGNHSKPLASINLPKSPTLLGNFCKGVKIYHFSSEIIFGQLLKTFGDFFWSHWLKYTLVPSTLIHLPNAFKVFFTIQLISKNQAYLLPCVTWLSNPCRSPSGHCAVQMGAVNDIWRLKYQTYSVANVSIWMFKL